MHTISRASSRSVMWLTLPTELADRSEPLGPSPVAAHTVMALPTIEVRPPHPYHCKAWRRRLLA